MLKLKVWDLPVQNKSSLLYLKVSKLLTSKLMMANKFLSPLLKLRRTFLAEQIVGSEIIIKITRKNSIYVNRSSGNIMLSWANGTRACKTPWNFYCDCRNVRIFISRSHCNSVLKRLSTCEAIFLKAKKFHLKYVKWNKVKNVPFMSFVTALGVDLLSPLLSLLKIETTKSVWNVWTTFDRNLSLMLSLYLPLKECAHLNPPKYQTLLRVSELVRRSCKILKNLLCRNSILSAAIQRLRNNRGTSMDWEFFSFSLLILLREFTFLNYLLLLLLQIKQKLRENKVFCESVAYKKS